jgi:hypothetical protein
MTTDTKQLLRTWPRFLRAQFSLRALLVLITVAAVFTWWSVQLPRGTITERQASYLRVGMTKSQVAWALGSPIGDRKGEIWAYRINNKPEFRLVVFDSHGNMASTVKDIYGR